ncbi:MAG: RNA polymerase sigma factor [Acidimicrobiales bacterium]
MNRPLELERGERASMVDPRTAREEFARLYPDLRRFAASICDFDDDPDDLLQEALMRVLRRGDLDDVDNFNAYLRRVIVNLRSNRRRLAARQKRLRQRVKPDVAHAAEPVYPSDLEILLTLRPIDRAIVFLVDVEGWSFAEVGALMGRPEASVRLRATRARRALRERIEKENPS